jgi:hypothetical protein
MTEQALDILKLVLLAMLYLFFARVLWAVWSEVRQPTNARQVNEFVAAPVATGSPTPAAGAAEPGRRDDRTPRPAKGRGGDPARLVILAPKQRRGTAFAITHGLGIGREHDNTVVILDDAFVSAHHVKISVVDGQVLVDDLASRNGTYLNGNRLTDQQRLRAGDRLQVGYTVLEAQ